MHRQADSKSLEPGQRVFDNDLPVTTHSRGLHRSDRGTHCQAEIRDVGPPNVSLLHRLRPTRVVRQRSPFRRRVSRFPPAGSRDSVVQSRIEMR
jgi:hypothetical protein